MFLTMNNVDFGYWLQAEREKKGWSQSDLARHSGLHRAVISKVESGTNPMPDTLTALAKALSYSPITVFRKAGLLPEGGEDVTFEDWKYLISQLDPQDEAELRKIAEMKIERKKKAQEVRLLKPKRAG